jgi:hypothetical protein
VYHKSSLSCQPGLFDVGVSDRHPRHGGIILAAAPSGGGSWTLSDLIAALDRLLSETEAGDWDSQVRWLNQWRR